jgi:hypothetical protein
VGVAEGRGQPARAAGAGRRGMMRWRGRGAVVAVVVAVAAVVLAAVVLAAASGRLGVVRRAVVSVSAGGGAGRSAPAAGGAAGRGGPGQRAGAGFEPVAASFLSPDRGFAFGLLQTTNAGRTWHPITFPAISPPPGRRPPPSPAPPQAAALAHSSVTSGKAGSSSIGIGQVRRSQPP